MGDLILRRTLKLALSPIGPIVPNVIIILSASSCDFQQCSWEIGSATADRAGQEVWVSAPGGGKQAWPCLGSAVERSWSAQGRPFPSILA